MAYIGQEEITESALGILRDGDRAAWGAFRDEFFAGAPPKKREEYPAPVKEYEWVIVLWWQNLSGLDLSAFDLTRVSFMGTDVSGTDLSDARFDRVPEITWDQGSPPNLQGADIGLPYLEAFMNDTIRIGALFEVFERATPWHVIDLYEAQNPDMPKENRDIIRKSRGYRANIRLAREVAAESSL
jgi:uncharacterized protein YjbI with pentapeptide repeats